MIIIFGGSGFIGRYLCCELKRQGRDPLCVGKSDRAKDFCRANGIPFLQVDINNKEDFRKLPTRDIEAVVHLVALIVELNPTTEQLLQNIIFGTYNVLEFSTGARVPKIIHTSTHKVYCDLWRPECLPIRTDHGPHFSGHASPYILSKLAAERLVQYYHEEYGMDGMTFRLTGVKGYGEIIGSLGADGSYKKSAIETFIEKAIRSEPIEIWGQHTARRDHIYVKDVVSCIIKAISTKGKSGVYNLASGKGVTIEDEAKAIVEVFSPPDRPSPLIYKPEIEDRTPSWVYDISDTVKAFSWEPQYGYKEMIQDYKNEMQTRRFAHFHSVRPENRPIYW